MAFGCAWFALAMLPVSNLVPLDAFMAEHWLYVPSMGLFMAVGWCVGRALRSPYRWAVTAAAAVVLEGPARVPARAHVHETHARRIRGGGTGGERCGADRDLGVGSPGRRL